MRSRDLAIAGAVVVLAGFAVADAVRNDTPTAPTSPAANGDSAPGTTAAREAGDDEGGREKFPPIPAPGSLVFAASDDCRLREVSVGTGDEFPLPRIPTSCELSAPPSGERVAYALGGSLGDAVRFRFVDLNHTGRDLGAFRALFGAIAWSGDGQRAGWCDARGRGFDYELGRELRRRERCPSAYTADGRVVDRDGRRLLVDGRALVTASGYIDHVAAGGDGSFGLLVDGSRLERWQDGRRTAAVSVRGPLAGRLPLFSPDNCAALIRLGPEVRLVELPCFRGRGSFVNVSPDNCLDRRKVTIARCARFRSPRTFPGTAAAWSPDGEWITVAADEDVLLFHRVVGRYDVVRWDTGARALAWLG